MIRPYYGSIRRGPTRVSRAMWLERPSRASGRAWSRVPGQCCTNRDIGSLKNRLSPATLALEEAVLLAT
jgi:hypothetical protein